MTGISAYRQGYCQNCKHCNQEIGPRSKLWLYLIGSVLGILFFGIVGSVVRRKKIEPEPIKVTISPNGFRYQDGAWVEDIKYYNGQNIRLVPYEHDGVVDFRMDTTQEARQ